jgi:transketolase
MKQKDLKRTIIDISYEKKLSHIGSCLSAVDIIDAVYSTKALDEKFVLSSGHAHLAHAVVMGKRDIPAGIHCDRDNGCDVSTGSLGQGLPIAVGMALSNRNKKVYCLISDGECAEGSIWESLRIAAEQKLTNLKVLVNANGYAAYREVDPNGLLFSFRAFGWGVIPVMGNNKDEIKTALLNHQPGIPIIIMCYSEIEKDYPLFKGLEGHYRVLTKEEYDQFK